MMQLFSPSYEVEECLSALRKVLESGWTGAGPECRRFESAWCAYTGSSHAHFLNSATAALHIAVRCLDLPPGSPILTTPLTFVSTNAVILYEGHYPVFVDINEEDLSLDATDFFNKMEKHQAKAAIWVHHGGTASHHFDEVMEHLPQGFQMIEDCAHAAGASYANGQKVGSRLDTTACFSYQAVKNLPTFDAGMISHSSAEYMARVRRLAWLGIDKDTFSRTVNERNELYKWKYDVPELGWKYNGNDIAAALANVQLNYLDRDNGYRKQIYEWYSQHLNCCVPHGPYSSHHLVVARVSDRDRVIETLKAEGISPGVHYLPNYQFPVFQKYYNPGQCPNTERISEEIVSLPNHLKLSEQDIVRVCEVVDYACCTAAV